MKPEPGVSGIWSPQKSPCTLIWGWRLRWDPRAKAPLSQCKPQLQAGPRTKAPSLHIWIGDSPPLRPRLHSWIYSSGRSSGNVYPHPTSGSTAPWGAGDSVHPLIHI